MTKLTFDVDFTKDPEEILKEIQERAREEVAKRESKEKAHAYLTHLHEVVNKEIGTSYKSLGDLIRALSAYSKGGAGREKVAKTSSSGRRVTISMNQEIYDEIKSLLAQPNPNKAAIARQTGASVVQVRKVASGGFDVKFGGGASSSASPKAATPAPKPEVTPLPTPVPAPKDEPKPEAEAEAATKPAPSLDLPPLAPEPPAPEPVAEEPAPEPEAIAEPAPLAPPPAPSLDLPPAPSLDLPPLAPEPPAPEPVSEELPAPSFGEDMADEPAPLAPPPAASMDLPPLAPEPPAPLSVPEPLSEEPPAPPSFGEEMVDEPAPLAPPPAPEPTDVPPAPPSGITQPPMSKPQGGPGKPSLSLKPKSGPGGKPGKPTLSLKKGKKKPMGLKITRPPMRPPSA